jgi:hypothetical protein
LPEAKTHGGGAAARPPDQASGLRRIFEPAPVRWTLVIHPGTRAARPGAALAAISRRVAATAGDTLVIDAARTHVATALGVRARFDLDHALAGDCALEAACIAAATSLWVLPAARALDAAAADREHAGRVAAAIGAIGTPMRNALVIAPAGRLRCLRTVPGLGRLRSALIPVTSRTDAGAGVLTAVRQAASEAEIDTFHLLFPGMAEAAAGRLLGGMAAIARRHFGVTLLAAGPVWDAPAASTAAGHPSVESVS